MPISAAVRHSTTTWPSAEGVEAREHRGGRCGDQNGSGNTVLVIGDLRQGGEGDRVPRRALGRIDRSPQLVREEECSRARRRWVSARSRFRCPRCRCPRDPPQSGCRGRRRRWCRARQLGGVVEAVKAPEPRRGDDEVVGVIGVREIAEGPREERCIARIDRPRAAPREVELGGGGAMVVVSVAEPKGRSSGSPGQGWMRATAPRWTTSTVPSGVPRGTSVTRRSAARRCLRAPGCW